MRARLLTASCLVHVNSQPFLRQPVTWWISRLHAKRTYFAGKPAWGYLRARPRSVLHKGPRAGISTRRVLRDAPWRKRSRLVPLEYQVRLLGRVRRHHSLTALRSAVAHSLIVYVRTHDRYVHSSTWMHLSALVAWSSRFVETVA